MVRAYCQSVATLNLLRAFATGGYAAMQRVDQWNLDFMERSEQGDRRRKRNTRLFLTFMCHFLAVNIGNVRKFSIYVHASQTKPVHVICYFVDRDIRNGQIFRTHVT